MNACRAAQSLAAFSVRRLEYRLKVERGATDDLEHLARRRLLLERVRQVAVTRLQFLEQPDVLDGDDGLVGERP